ncbi:MAG TPA: YihY/virulence factor BrkB family protein [Gammaproteobacteria bacterium]|nr:YihY/virulence factor BrkB family protein [Gammaproteobacteria bacterium]
MDSELAETKSIPAWAGPSDISAKGWVGVLGRVRKQISDDNLSIIAAGAAFYGLLALFPAMAALVSIYGLFTDPQAVEQQMQSVQSVLPAQAAQLLQQQMHRVASGAGGALSLGAIIGFLLTIWSATKGMKSLMTALNVAYDVPETRGLLKLNGLALLLTLGLLVFAVVALVAIAFVPAALAGIGLPGPLATLVRWLRWPLLAGASVLVLAILYRYGVSRPVVGWRWVVWGAVAGTLLWLIGSGLFSWYVSNFGNYNETYGSLGAVAVLMLWFWLSAYFVLLGGELNAEMERRVRDKVRRDAPDAGIRAGRTSEYRRKRT